MLKTLKTPTSKQWGTSSATLLILLLVLRTVTSTSAVMTMYCDTDMMSLMLHAEVLLLVH